MADKVKVIHLDKVQYPEAIEIINELAELQRRTPHDTAQLLIRDAGAKEIELLKQKTA